MNSKFRGMAKNLSFSVFANMLSLAISVLVSFVVPKLISVMEYSHIQAYINYVSLAGFFHLGWADGIYLRYGGKEYGELDKPVFHTQFWMLTVFEIALSALIAAGALLFVSDAERRIILPIASLNCFILLPRTMLQYILQGTNRIKDYAGSVVLEKVLYCALIIVMLAVGVRNYEMLLLADILAKAASLLSICWICRDIVLGKGVPLRSGWREAGANIAAGNKLMFANIAGILIMFIMRTVIQMAWDDETFGKVSLTISVSNMLMVFISAISIVVFPLLKRTSPDRWTENYRHLHTMLVVPVLGVLILYYPARLLLSMWLPEYAEKLKYMALLFPMCLFEGKMSLIINTYLKALRKERIILFVNVVTVTLSLLAAGLVFWHRNLDLAVLSIVLLLAFRCELSEWLLSRHLQTRVAADMISEMLMAAVFIVLSWVVGGWAGFAAYAAVYVLYLALRRKSIGGTLRMLIAGVKQRE